VKREFDQSVVERLSNLPDGFFPGANRNAAVDVTIFDYEGLLSGKRLR
jgi:hypothetical protein